MTEHQKAYRSAVRGRRNEPADNKIKMWSIRDGSELVKDARGQIAYFERKSDAKQLRDELNMGLTGLPFMVTKGPTHPEFDHG